ncbi:MAG: putative conserved integral membrane protein [Candidatus Ozemobacter sibiricus]|uniref:Putative conserved integral membrane protein n=1 Tax=Candidatus Ozemobacter sibiricus TaxID=2268124 RepID=A0A367ZU27_9BACT|nr:MAG: putative conserved integral membrane protein [Candidatus Ozemobacter sibiricus]
MWEMVMGQLAILLNLLLVIAFLQWRQGREVLGGMALGAAIALKLTGWPLVLWLAAERRWKAVLATAGSTIGFNLLALTYLPWTDLLKYYREVGPLASQLYAWNALNISVFGLTGMMFRGCATRAIQGLSVSPLVEAPALVFPLGALLLLALCGLAWWGLSRADLPGKCRYDVGFAVFTCLSIVSNPVAWAFSLPMALIPVWVLWRLLAEAPDPLPWWGLGGVAVCLVFPQIFLEKILGYVYDPAPVPFLIGLVLLIPLAGVIGLGMLLIRQARLSQACEGT